MLANMAFAKPPGLQKSNTKKKKKKKLNEKKKFIVK